MYLMYVDESGDPGMVNSPSSHFALSGLVMHELMWHKVLDATIDFRRQLRIHYGLKLREEIHASQFVNSPGPLARIRKDLRLLILRRVLEFQAQIPDLSIINVVVSKAGKTPQYDVFESAWRVLIQRFYNTIVHRNFPNPGNGTDYGLVICDTTDVKKLQGLTRRMRHYNPVPNMAQPGWRGIVIDRIVEDAWHKDSAQSFLLQLADVNAYFLYQLSNPSNFIRRKSAQHYFYRLEPVLCKVASRINPYGIVLL